MNSRQENITSWGMFPRRDSKVLEPDTLSSCQSILEENKSLTPRGLGRSYGDASLGEAVLEPGNRANFLEFDSESGLLIAQAGVSLDDILTVFVPRGWFLPVTPGTRKVTLGGAFAADVHGKNHHMDGSFSDHVEFIDILLESGECLRASRDEHPQLFYATAGGMGLTGFILNLGLKLRKIESAYIRQRAVQAPNFEELIRLLRENEETSYTVAWIDCLSKGSSLGRGIYLGGEHAKLHETNVREVLKVHRQQEIKVPFYFPRQALNSFSIAAFNELYYRKQIYPNVESILHYSPFFHPLDILSHWNRIYGREGFLQYQFVVPFEGGDKVMKEILEEIAKSGYGSFLAVLKIFGEASEGYLSFPRRGYTLALDFPYCEGTLELMDRLDIKVLDAGGRFYLAKDARMSAESFQAGYREELKVFREVLEKYAPKGVFQSDLSRRLRIRDE